MAEVLPAVSVTICCYNSERYIAETIQSVLDQTYSDFELVIVNDGSTDRTEEIIHRFSDPRIRYKYQRNRGLGPTRNRTLELARGRYVAFLDHDDLWFPEKLAIQIPIMESRPDVAVVYSDATTVDSRGKKIWRDVPRFRSRDGNVFDDLLDMNFINWQTVVIRRSILDEVGGFRPYRITEDYDMLLRCAATRTFVGIDKVLAAYRWHGENTARHASESLLEVIDIKRQWLEDLPPQHEHLRPFLERWLGERDYWMGRVLCLEGNTKAGRSYLRKARLTSSRKGRSMLLIVLSALLGDAGFPVFARWLRHLPIPRAL